MAAERRRPALDQAGHHFGLFRRDRMLGTVRRTVSAQDVRKLQSWLESG